MLADGDHMRSRTILALSTLTLALTVLATTAALAVEATTYKGRIGKTQVVLELADPSDTDAFVARYAYMSRGIDIPLHGRIDDDGRFVIEEEAPCDESCRNADGMLVDNPPIGADWLLTKKDRLGHRLSGQWKDRKSGKSLPITLERVGTRTLVDGPITLDHLDPVSAIVGLSETSITPSILPYDMLKLDFPIKKGAEIDLLGATIRMDTDPRTTTSYPAIVRLPQAEPTAINRWLRQRWLQFQFNPYYCLSTAYLGLGWTGGEGQGSNGIDGADVRIEYLTPRLLGLVENGSIYCGGAHPSNFENRHFADVQTGEPLQAERLLKGWVPKNAEGEEIDPTTILDENRQDYGPNAELVAFINARRNTSDAAHDEECGISDLISSNMGVYFTPDALVFNLKNLPHVIFACTDDLVRVPIQDARTLLNERGAYYLGLRD
jgi:hypothetical protein